MSGLALLGAAFLAGALSFVSPCVLPLTPVYIAQLTGPAVWRSHEMAARERAELRLATTLHAASFVAGFTLMFIAFGATASVLGVLLALHETALRQVGGVILALFGLTLAGVIRAPWLDRERRLTVRPANRGYASSFVIGLIFALGWTPCVGPILASILVLAAQAHSLGSGVLLLAMYSLGLGIPFLALGVAFDRFGPALKRLSPYLPLIERVTGALLVVMGVVIFFNWLIIINSHIRAPGLG